MLTTTISGKKQSNYEGYAATSLNENKKIVFVNVMRATSSYM